MIKFVVFDFDGVFTDGMFYFDNENNIKKSYNAKDAYSLTLLKNDNIKCGIITNDKTVSIEHAPHVFNRLDKISIGNNEPKLNILNKWMQEYNMTCDEIAYIGDDLPDIEILKKVGFSACPRDAVDDVKNICKYICKKNGGHGAVREFVDLIIKNNNFCQINHKISNNEKITAVIPVRKGSTRCKNKNIRNFGNTNLLKLKIETLKKVKGIHNIIVSSNCDAMIDIARTLGVDIHRRNNKYCTNENPGDFFCDLAKTIDTNVLMHVPVTTPLINTEQYNDMIIKWNEVKLDYDSLNATTKIKEFIWHNNESVNYDRYNPPPSQELPDFNYLNFGCNIIRKESVLNLNNVIGKKPFMFDINSTSSIDIDENSDFIMSELLYKNNITDDKICKSIMEKRINKLLLCDCTIRDGGYLNNWNFSDEEVSDCYKAVTESGYDYFEIGFRTNENSLTGKGKWCYSIEDDVNKIYETYNGCKIAVMAKMGTVTIDDFLNKNESNITMVRVLLAKSSTENGVQKSKYVRSDIIKAKYFCEQLLNYGYEICINLACGDIIDDDEIEIIASEFYDIDMKALYLADTYGGFNVTNIPIQLHKFYTEFNKYNSKVPFGFHFHNNNEDAMGKAIIAIEHGCSMIDSCISGLGRGAGNLKSEQLMSYIHNDKSKYIKNITPLIMYFDKHVIQKKKYCENHNIHSHPYYMISGILSLHPDYIAEILKMDTGVEQDIDLILKIHMYTEEKNEKNYNKKLITIILKK